MSYKRWLLTVHWEYIPKTTYIFVHLSTALYFAAIVKKSHPDTRINLIRKKLTPEQCAALVRKLNPNTRINLIRKELTPEQCEAVLNTGNLPT